MAISEFFSQVDRVLKCMERVLKKGLKRYWIWLKYSLVYLASVQDPLSFNEPASEMMSYRTFWFITVVIIGNSEEGEIPACWQPIFSYPPVVIVCSTLAEDKHLFGLWRWRCGGGFIDLAQALLHWWIGKEYRCNKPSYQVRRTFHTQQQQQQWVLMLYLQNMETLGCFY